MRNSPESRPTTPIAFICLVALFSYFSINVVQTMTSEYSHQDKLLSLEQQVANLAEKKESLQEDLQRVKGEDFIEAEARNKLHLGKPNEKVAIFPQETNVLASTDINNASIERGESVSFGYIDEWVRYLKGE